MASATTLVLSGALMEIPQAHAYFPGKIVVDGAELKQQPRPDSPTVKSIPKGTSFNAADQPKNGYYYIRTANDLGWVDGPSIGIGTAPTTTHTAPKQAPVARNQQPNQTAPQKNSSHRKRALPYTVKAHLDYNIFDVGDLNSATQTTSFSNAMGLGFEFAWFFDARTAVGFRLDSIGQQVSAYDQTNAVTLDFKLSTLALMAGVERILWEDPKFYISALGYLGLAPSKLTMDASGSSIPAGTATTTEFSHTGFTFLGLFEGGWKVHRNVSLYGEAGYRFLNNSNLSPTKTGAGSNFLPDTISLNFTGPVIGFGVRGRF